MEGSIYLKAWPGYRYAGLLLGKRNWLEAHRAP